MILVYTVSTICWIDYSFPFELCWIPIKNQFVKNNLKYKGLFLDSQFHFINLHVYSYVSNTLITLAFWWILKSESMNRRCPSLSNCLAILEPLNFHMNFRISLPISLKRAVGFWQGLHWICWLAWGILPPITCWIMSLQKIC